MIVEKEEQLQDIQEALNKGDSLWIPMYSDPYSHYMNNSISFIYIWSMAINNYFIRSNNQNNDHDTNKFCNYIYYQ